MPHAAFTNAVMARKCGPPSSSLENAQGYASNHFRSNIRRFQLGGPHLRAMTVFFVSCIRGNLSGSASETVRRPHLVERINQRIHQAPERCGLVTASPEAPPPQTGISAGR